MAEFSLVPADIQNLLEGERQPQGIPPLDVWMVERIREAQQENGHVDPWYVSDSFFTYRSNVLAKMTELQGADTFRDAEHAASPEERAFLAFIDHTHHAYDVAAYPFYNPQHQKTIQLDIKDGDTLPQGSFMLDGREKQTLQTITTAAGIPDNPQQLTYSFASLPPAPTVVRGSTG